MEIREMKVPCKRREIIISFQFNFHILLLEITFNVFLKQFAHKL